jgi:hypothetical protein
MPKQEQQLNREDAEKEAFEIQENLKKNQKPSEDGVFSKEQYQEEYEKLQKSKENQEEMVLTPEQQEDAIVNDLMNSKYPSYELSQKKLSEQIEKRIVEKIINSYFIQSNFTELLNFCINTAGCREIVKSPEYQLLAKEAAFMISKEHDIATLIKMKDLFALDDKIVVEAVGYGFGYEDHTPIGEITLGSEFQQAAKEAVIKFLDGSYEYIGNLKDIFGSLEQVIHSSEIQQKALETTVEIIFPISQDIDDVILIKEQLGISDDAILSQLKNKIDQFKKEHIDQMPAIKAENIKYLGNETFNKIPSIYEYFREFILSDLSTNLDLADYFVENLDKYYDQPWVAENVAKAVQHYSVAKKFASDAGHHPTWVKELWVLDVLEKAKETINEHDIGNNGNGDGSHGFSESDPYEKHENLFSGKKIIMASAISNFFKEGKTEDLGKLGINELEITKLLAEINEKIESEYKIFLQKAASNRNMSTEDVDALTNPESVKMTPLIDNIKSYVARLIVLECEGDIQRIKAILDFLTDSNQDSDEIFLQPILEEGFDRYLKVYEVDIPLYDKLYEEFDNLRETGRKPMEVYLGRDGIYAWIGRRAQDQARRRKLGPEGRKSLREKGEIVEIHPKYLVYPRYFRDNLNYDTKRQFLEQERITFENDPLFYDTGYTGTIPEQIMRVMDFSEEEIEQRIRLLSAPSPHRRVKGIPENARSEIIEHIEHNPKTENVAEGLIIDEKTGKIRHIAKPTYGREQFHFMMISQAIGRHYWAKEYLHHEPSGNVNLDSENYTIRIREEYAKLLPKDFLKNPKEFFENQGKLMKGGKGEGQYPDEEILLFNLTDGTEIVAKRIELRKAKEARKEFSILIAAKKAGLRTAEPVGFLSGKSENDKDYLLMEKLEGHSGRTFEKELIKSGKYSDEQIKSIMQIIAEKNKEIAELFRTTLQIDKRWRIKDTVIEFNEETGEVGVVIPIDWERAQEYNPKSPKEIDEIN